MIGSFFIMFLIIVVGTNLMDNNARLAKLKREKRERDGR